EPPVQLGRDAPVADVGAQRVGEVDRGGVRGQQDRAAGRGEDDDLGLGEVAAQRREELCRVGGGGLPVEDAAQPVELLGACGGASAAGVLRVAEVRDDAVLGGAVHGRGPDEHLEQLV